MPIDLERLQDDLYNLRIESRDQRALITQLQAEQDVLRAQSVAPVTGAPPIVNYIRNGDFSHSWDTWNRPAPVADDARFECWQVYSHTVPVAGQQLLEDSVFSGALVAASKALPDAARSDTPVVDPDWQRTIGYARLGSTNTLDFPLPSNVAFPGRKLYVILIVARRSANVGVPGRLFAGIWDNTAGQRDWLMGSTFALTAQVIGTPAVTTSTEYLVVMTSDFGSTVKSAILTVPNAPSDASFISGSVYVKLSWPRFAGFIHSDVYRKRGGVFQLVSQESTVNEYFDQGDFRQIVGAYPDTDATKPKAYAATRQGALDQVPIDGVDPAWQSFTLAVEIPATYNQSVTTGKQWLRLGLDAPCTGADAARGLFIDLVGMSYVSGSYAHNADDLKGLQQPIAAPAGSTQGGAGTGGSGFVPPDGGTGEGREPRCIMADSMVVLMNGTFPNCRAEQLLLHPEYKLLSVDEQGNFVAGEIERVQEDHVPFAIHITTETGQILRCSESHRLITQIGDIVGIPVSRLSHGDPVIVFDPKTRTLHQTAILRRHKIRQRTRVIRIQMKRDSPQTYVAGNILSHNVKIQDQF